MTTHKKHFVLLFFVSLLFFALEILVFSGLRFATYYFRAQLVIALGLLGLSLGGAIATFVKEDGYALKIFLGTVAVFLSPLFGFAGILISPINFYISMAILTFAFAPYGFLIGIFYRMLDPFHTYAVELLGGATGLILSLFLLRYAREEGGLLILLFAGAILIPAFFWNYFTTNSRKLLWLFPIFLLAVALFFQFRYDYINLAEITPCRWPETRTFPKLTCQKAAFPSYRVVRSFGSVVDRIDILDFGRGMLHTAFSGDGTDGIKPYPPLPYHQIDARLPAGLIENPKVLIVGTAAEGVVKVVKAVGASEITSIDINPAITKLWTEDREIIEYAKDPFAGVRLKTIDGRAFLETSKERYDIITMMNTHRSRDAGAFGEPDFLHTKEAFRAFWARLSDNGFLSFEEKNINFIAEGAIKRTTATLVAALSDLGVKTPADHIVAYEWTGAFPPAREKEIGGPGEAKFVPYVQFLVKREPWGREDTSRLQKWAAESARRENLVMPTNMVFHRWLWLPGNNELIEKDARYLWKEIAGDAFQEYVLTDDRPFPVFLSEIAKDDFSRSMYFFLALIGGLFAWLLIRRGKEGGALTKASLFFYFIFIGVGYMFLEIMLLQRLQFYLGSVTVSLIVAIGALLLSSALVNFFPRSSFGLKRHTVTFLLLVAMVLAVPYFLNNLFFRSFIARLAVSIFLAGALGWSLGFFFPHAMKAARDSFPGFEPLFAGVNGGAMAMAVPLSFYVSSLWGLNFLAMLALFLYFLAVVIFSPTSILLSGKRWG